MLAIAYVLLDVSAFQHMNRPGEGDWTLGSFIFTSAILVITIGGSYERSIK